MDDLLMMCGGFAFNVFLNVSKLVNNANLTLRNGKPMC